MAEATQDKPTGLKFAEQQLLRHGWEKGKGLGRRESGISEAIKVKIKCDKGGVGHKEGEQFTFHWWDHVFNKASSNLVVETGQDGVKVKADDTNNVLISNKKPTKAQQTKSMLYGSFVKSATLLSGEVQPEKPSESDDSSSSSSEDEDHKLDLSSTTKLSDADLLKACGGRTAHKGARHGLTMNAKLARLEQQELEFMNKYGKNNKSAQTSTNPEDHPDATEKTKRKKSKRKEKPSEKDSNGSVFVNDDTMTDAKTKKKKNRKAQPGESFNGDCGLAGNMESALTTEGLHEELNEAASSVEEDNVPKKEKKKKKKRMVASLDNTDVISEDFIDKQPHEDSKHQQTSDSVSKKKRKKKSSMDHHESSPSTDTRNSISAMMIIEDTNTQEDMEIEGQEKNRKKNKKTKRLRKMEEQDVDEQVTFDDSVPKKKKKKSKE